MSKLNRFDEQYIYGFTRAAEDIDSNPEKTLKSPAMFTTRAMNQGYKDGIAEAVNPRRYVSRCIHCHKHTENSVFCSMPCAEGYYWENSEE